ncbi:hypothetical protein JXJ21_26280 [candidate division KSB1 bacterium]|nr:hypothetical protein [candidate division KSB1 bacterium]
MQTSFEIIDGLLRNQPVERMGVNDAPWYDTLQKWAREEGYPTNDSDDPVSPTDYFDFDLCGCGPWFDAMPLPDYKETIEETDQWIISRNGAGAALKYWKHKSGTPEHIDFLMNSRRAWDNLYRPHLLELNRQRLKIEETRNELAKRRAQGKWAFYGHLFIWELMRQSMGDICMYESLLLDPDWIHDYNRVYTDFYKTHFRILIEEAGKPDGIWLYEDLGYSQGLFCSPSALEKLIFPYYKEIIDFFHDFDLPVVLHSCGGVTEALPLIVDVGFDGLNPMEVKAGCDVLKYAEQYGDRLAFFGGMDKKILESGNRSLIKTDVERIIEGMKGCGARYVFGSDHSLSPNVRLADFKFALEIYRQNMWY